MIRWAGFHGDYYSYEKVLNEVESCEYHTDVYEDVSKVKGCTDNSSRKHGGEVEQDASIRKKTLAGNRVVKVK